MRRIGLKPWKRVLLATVLTAPIAVPLLSPAHALAQSQPEVAASPTFEVASIKLGDPASHGMQIQIAPGGRFTAKNVNLKLLVQQAYGVRDFQISGGPGWIASDRYDILAKAEGTANGEQLKIMLQALLADRFKLVIHRDTKELPVYALVVGKNGPKLQKSEADGPETDGKRKGQVRMGRGQINAQGVPVAMFANQLANRLGRTVLDKTGLEGNYDFKLDWTPDESEMAAMAAMREGRPEMAPPIDPSGPSIFTALQEQLGLKLESQKGPVEILVIDRVEKPTEN